MRVQSKVPLAPFTTFKIGGPAAHFCIVKDQFDALNAYEFAAEKKLPVFVLGGGSNVLVSDKGFKGLVAKVENKGIEITSQDEISVVLKVASGEIWDEVVKFAVTNGWWGIENLSHIPGSTGAIAVQNVGAYGQEAKNVIESVIVFNRETNQILSLDNKKCGFAYRSSIFNTLERGKYIIFSVNLRLKKKGTPNLSYRDLKSRFGEKEPSLAEIRGAVIEIRNKKYPFPTEAKNGNAGSFFKNLAVDKAGYKNLKFVITKNFGLAAVEKLEQKIFLEAEVVKVPVAYLMELCGLKDLTEGGAKINHTQPLVIINETGQAKAADVLNLAKKVLKTVHEKTGIWLKLEPELVGFYKHDLDAILNLTP